MSSGPLVHEGDNDYLLPDGANESTVWITVGNLSVQVARKDEGVSVCLYPLDREGEANNCLGETWATFAEAKPEEEDA